jgi:hypothetical protein
VEKIPRESRRHTSAGNGLAKVGSASVFIPQCLGRKFEVRVASGDESGPFWLRTKHWLQAVCGWGLGPPDLRRFRRIANIASRWIPSQPDRWLRR